MAEDGRAALCEPIRRTRLAWKSRSPRRSSVERARGLHATSIGP